MGAKCHYFTIPPFFNSCTQRGEGNLGAVPHVRLQLAHC
jgi:hypothetical protein